MEKTVERGLDWAGLAVIATVAPLLCSDRYRDCAYDTGSVLPVCPHMRGEQRGSSGGALRSFLIVPGGAEWSATIDLPVPANAKRVARGAR